jgi:hypothetical protein
MESSSLSALLNTLNKWENKHAVWGAVYKAKSGVWFEFTGDTFTVIGNSISFKQGECAITISLKDTQEFEYYPPSDADSITALFKTMNEQVEEGYKIKLSSDDFLVLFKVKE